MTRKQYFYIGLTALVIGGSALTVNHFNTKSSHGELTAEQLSNLAPAAGEEQAKRHEETMAELETLLQSDHTPEELLAFYEENGLDDLALIQRQAIQAYENRVEGETEPEMLQRMFLEQTP